MVKKLAADIIKRAKTETDDDPVLGLFQSRYSIYQEKII